jgi:uncharacterized membrane protein YebE (DUF533 family)
MNEEQKNIYLPADLYSSLEQRAKAGGFDTLDSYIATVLRDMLKAEKAPGRDDSREEADIKKRLKDLGYLS